MKALFVASLKMIVRDKQSLFWALAFPIIFLGVFRLFSFDSFGTTDVIVSVQDEASQAQQTLVTALQDSDFLEVTVAEAPLTAEEASVEIDEDRTDAVLLVTSSGPGVEARLLHNIGDPIGSAATEAGIASVVDGVNLQLQGGRPPIVYEAERLDADETTFFEFLGPGIIGMGLMTFATISLAGSLSRYREEGVLRRIRATPLEPWKFFGSVVLAHMTVATIQVIVIATVAEVLGANVLRGGIPFLVLAVLGTVIFLNIGVILAGLVHGRGAVEGAANAITLPMMFLSGTFFPVGQLPELVRILVQALPLTHLLTSMRALVEGETVISQWPEFLILAGWIIGTAIVARFTFSLEDDG